MTTTKAHLRNETQDLYKEIKTLRVLLANSYGSLQDATREAALWEQRYTYLEEEMEELVADTEEYDFRRCAWLSAQGNQC